MGEREGERVEGLPRLQDFLLCVASLKIHDFRTALQDRLAGPKSSQRQRSLTPTLPAQPVWQSVSVAAWTFILTQITIWP